LGELRVFDLYGWTSPDGSAVADQQSRGPLLDPTLRAAALELLARVADRRHVNALVGLIETIDERTRRAAYSGLLRIAGADAPTGFDPAQPGSAQVEALAQWRTWLRDRSAPLALGSQLDGALWRIEHGDDLQRIEGAAQLKRMLDPAAFNEAQATLREGLLADIAGRLGQHQATIAAGADSSLARLIEAVGMAHESWQETLAAIARGTGHSAAQAARALREARWSLEQTIDLLNATQSDGARRQLLLALLWSTEALRTPAAHAALSTMLPDLLPRCHEASRREALRVAADWRVDAAADAIASVLSSKPAADQETLRLAVEALTALGKPLALGELVGLLNSEQQELRAAAYQALQRLSGQSLKFDPAASKEERSSAVANWKHWWDLRHAGQQLDEQLASDASAQQLARKLEELPAGLAVLDQRLVRRTPGRSLPQLATPVAQRRRLLSAVAELNAEHAQHGRELALALLRDPEAGLRDLAFHALLAHTGSWSSQPLFSAAPAAVSIEREATRVELAWDREQLLRRLRRQQAALVDQLLLSAPTSMARLRDLARPERPEPLRLGFAIVLPHAAQAHDATALTRLDERIAAELATLKAPPPSQHGEKIEEAFAALESARAALARNRWVQAIEHVEAAARGVEEANRPPLAQLANDIRGLADGAQRSLEVAAALIDLLADPSGPVRSEAIAGLERLTGERLGYEPTDPRQGAGGEESADAVAARTAAIARWRSWQEQADPATWPWKDAARREQHRAADWQRIVLLAQEHQSLVVGYASGKLADPDVTIADETGREAALATASWRRVQALRLLGLLATPDALPVLVDALDDALLQLRQEAARNLERIAGGDLDFGYVADKTSPERQAAIKSWRQWAEQQGSTKLALTSQRDNKHLEALDRAAQLLALLGNPDQPEIWDALAANAEAPTPAEGAAWIRRAAYTAFLDLASPVVGPQLPEYLHEQPDATLRQANLERLELAWNQEKRLRQEQQARGLAMLDLARAASDARTVLSAALEKEQPVVTRRVLTALVAAGAIHSAECAPWLLGQLLAAERSVRLEALRGLSRLNHGETYGLDIYADEQTSATPEEQTELRLAREAWHRWAGRFKAPGALPSDVLATMQTDLATLLGISEQGLALVRGWLAAAEPSTRLLAIALLAVDQRAIALSELATALGDAEASVRQAAYDALLRYVATHSAQRAAVLDAAGQRPAANELEAAWTAFAGKFKVEPTENEGAASEQARSAWQAWARSQAATRRD
jgi:HEAT repeat protein